MSGDIYIYYSGSSYIECDCSRYDISNYSVTIETWLKKSDLQTLRSNITPGAVGELYKVLGRPTYYDKTWTKDNTLRITPQSASDSSLHDMRNEKVIYVKNMSDSPIYGPSGWLNVKIEGYISGSQTL